MNKLFVGIDISLHDYKVVVLDQEGEDVINPFAVDNNEPGTNELISNVLLSCKTQKSDKLFFALESTSLYGWHVQHALADCPHLKPYKPVIICFNPKLVEKFKKSLGNIGKDDWIDANAVAERLRFGRLPKTCAADFRYLALQRLTRYRYHIVQNIVREKSYYLSNLFLKFSGMCQEQIFSNNFGFTATSLFYEYSTLEDIASSSLNELIDFIIDQGKGRFKDPVRTAKNLKQAAKKSYKLRPTMENSLGFVIRSCLDNITALNTQKKSVEKIIKRQVKNFRNEFLCLDSVKGIGPVIAAGIISEIGGISRFDNNAALAKYSGIYWSKYQSGKFTADDTSLQKTGNAYLRYYFVQAAEQLRKYLPEYSDYYTRKFKESRTHHHKRALILTARKAVRLIFALLRDEKLYKPPARKGDDLLNNM